MTNARPFRAPLLALAVLLTGGPAVADARVGRLDLDPRHTVVAFHLAGNLHEVHGTFALASGSLTVDPESGAASGTVVVDAASGESGNASRDARMASVVLATNRFPEIRLRAERAEGQQEPDGDFHGMLFGVLTLHGDDHDVALVVDGHLAGDALVAHARFTVPYVAWGLPDPSILLLTVAKTVDVDVTTEGHVTWLQP